jgi:hypothetical protein
MVEAGWVKNNRSWFLILMRRLMMVVRRELWEVQIGLLNSENLSFVPLRFFDVELIQLLETAP